MAKPKPLKYKVKKMKELIEMVTVDTLGKCKRCGKEDWIDLHLGICSKCFLEIVKQRKFVWLEDLNSALQGLKSDIIEEWKFDEKLTLKRTLEKIKKWFPDVVEDD